MCKSILPVTCLQMNMANCLCRIEEARDATFIKNKVDCGMAQLSAGLWEIGQTWGKSGLQT